MTNYQDIDYALAALLLDRVQSKKGTISYGDCAKELSYRIGQKINPHFNLTTPLYHVAELCFDLGLPSLTAFVVYQNDCSGTVTGQGFYKMMCEFKPDCKTHDPTAVWKSELVRVRQCADWSPLVDYLSQHY